MPMKKHELIYVFYRKLPFYNLSSHKHKIIKERTGNLGKNGLYGKDNNKLFNEGKYEPPLPTTIITNSYLKKTEGKENTVYGKIECYNYDQRIRYNGSVYDPPLPNSILEIKSEKGKHSTQKPIKLIEWILKYYSKEGDIILDPTMGSGTTGVACKNMNRQFIGIEKDIKYFEISKNRINNE